MNYKNSNFISCRRSLLDECLENIKPRLKGNVLDVGGRNVQRRGTFTPPHELVSSWVTINPDPKAKADYTGGLPRLPFPDRQFDFVICTEVLEYIEDVEASVADMCRILKENGTAYLSVPFLHRLHGDSEADCLRFTGAYLERLFCRHFSTVEISPMGGVSAVVFDLIWAKAARFRLLRPAFRLAGRLVVKRSLHSAAECTGFFVVARKQSACISGLARGAKELTTL